MQQINFRLNRNAYEIMCNIRKTTNISFSDIARKLINGGIISTDIGHKYGNTVHIVGAMLSDDEMNSLTALCKRHNLQHSDCMRLLLAGYASQYSVPKNIEDAILMMSIGRHDLVEKYVRRIAGPAQIDDNTPHDRRLLLWIPSERQWVIGRWDDDRYASKPKPFWLHEGEQITYSRNNPPSHYKLLPEEPENDDTH